MRKAGGKAVMPGPEKASAAETGANPEERRAMDDLFSLIYEELRRLASFVRKNEANATISSTALVHEAWLKLKDSPHLAETSPPHFKAIAAKAMRHVLVDAARRRNAQKRSAGEAAPAALHSSNADIASSDFEMLA